MKSARPSSLLFLSLAGIAGCLLFVAVSFAETSQASPNTLVENRTYLWKAAPQHSPITFETGHWGIEGQSYRLSGDRTLDSEVQELQRFEYRERQSTSTRLIKLARPSDPFGDASGA